MKHLAFSTLCLALTLPILAADPPAVLSYDYTTQVITGNLSDTVRIIYVYVTKK